MAKTYLIENCVIYNPETHTLRSIKNDNLITLVIPASLCFNMLLQHKGVIISQAEILKSVWGDRGMNVTPNALYQNISLLRKSLKLLDIPDLIVQTIPKRGFMISGKISVQEQGGVIKAEDSEEVKNISFPDSEDKVSPEESRTHLQPFSKVVPFIRKSLVSWEITIIATIIILIIIIINRKLADNSDLLSSYSKLYVMPDCAVFRDNDLRPDHFFIDFIKRNNISCSKEQTIYITNHYPSSRTSVITCQHPVNDTQRSYCISHYYLK